MQQAPAQTELACSQCGRMLAQSDLVQIAGNWVCGQCKPAYLSRVMAGETSVSRWHYGGFWIRYAAKLIDGVLLIAVQASLALVLLGSFGGQFEPSVLGVTAPGRRLAFQTISYTMAILYEAAFLRYRGATPGKMALGLKVVRDNGDPLGWGVAIGRYFMTIVSALILGIGYIMAAFDDQKRALHDRVCNTRVVYIR